MSSPTVTLVGPHVACRVRLRGKARQQRPVVARGIGRGPGPDQPVASVNAEMVRVAERRHDEVEARRAVVGRLGPGELDRPARISVLLPELGRLVVLIRWDPSRPDLGLLALAVALLGRGHDRRVDDLATHGQEARLGQRRLIGPEQYLDRKRRPQATALRCGVVG